MSPNESPAPRGNAEGRANRKTERADNRRYVSDWEADAVALWLTRRFAMPAALARILAALASLARAFR